MRNLFVWLTILLVAPVAVSAQEYRILDFSSQIELQKNTDLKISETIKVNFLVPKHGIFRTIPVRYESGAKMINSKLKVNSVSDERNNAYEYETSREGDSLQIKIGDPFETITGLHTYKINYVVENITQRFDDHDEVYWNVTGSNWDVPVEKSSVNFVTEFAPITMVDCFSGAVGSTSKRCIFEEVDDGLARGATLDETGVGSDFTIVVGLDSNNRLQFPSLLERLWEGGYFGFIAVFAPAFGMAYLWWTRGRDEKYSGDNVYYQQENAVVKNVSPFARPHLPNVYGPIQGLTPSEAGTIIDQKVDLQDLVAEIVELARLKYLTIKEVDKKWIFGKKDYHFVIPEKDTSKLKPHQKLLWDALRKPSYKTEENNFALSKMKNKFYTDLNKFKDSLYKTLVTEKIFATQPDSSKSGWFIFAFVSQMVVTNVVAIFINPAAIPLGFLSGFIAVAFAFGMPRRTARGYSLYRQLTGLQYFVGKGKWRYDIAEKRLFLEEILPLAISLGVVDKLSQDMADLALKDPQYLGNMHISGFNAFSSSMGSTLSSTPSSSRSGWSGGSGFSGGGSSGGGGGGGGGGSW